MAVPRLPDRPKPRKAPQSECLDARLWTSAAPARRLSRAEIERDCQMLREMTNEIREAAEVWRTSKRTAARYAKELEVLSWLERRLDMLETGLSEEEAAV